MTDVGEIVKCRGREKVRSGGIVECGAEEKSWMVWSW